MIRLDPTLAPRRFRRTCAAAVIALTLGHAALGADEARVELERPVRVSLRTEGRSTPMRGEITAWKYGAFWLERPGADAAIRIGWDEIGAKTAYETARRILGRDDAVGYFRLGVEMLVMDDPKQARRAFDYAVQQDSAILADTKNAMTLWETGADPVEAFEAMQTRAGADPVGEGVTGERSTEENRYQPPTPEDDSQAAQGTAPWKPLGPEERERAIEVQRQYAATAGLDLHHNQRLVIETDHFIMATDLSEAEARRWSGQLEVMYATMLEMFELPEETTLYAGKCNVFVFASQGDFLRFEERAMGINAKGFGGLCHYRGEDVIISFYRYGSEADFQHLLIHESVHGFLYRYRTPARIPTWINEGLAEYIAAYLTPASNRSREEWNSAKNFVNRRKDPIDVMRNFYGDRKDRTLNESYSVSSMLVRFLLKHRPAEFRQWLDDLTTGADWEQAMRQRFGVDAARLSEGFSQDIRSETSYTGLR